MKSRVVESPATLSTSNWTLMVKRSPKSTVQRIAPGKKTSRQVEPGPRIDRLQQFDT